MLTTRNVRLDSGRYATKYYSWWEPLVKCNIWIFKQLNSVYNSTLSTYTYKKKKSSHGCNRFILTFSGRDCMDNVCRRVNLQQPDLFGLKFYSRRSYPKYRWVDLDRPLKKQLDKYAQQPTGPLHLGTIHILRKHLYSTKHNFLYYLIFHQITCS